MSVLRPQNGETEAFPLLQESLGLPDLGQLEAELGERAPVGVQVTPGAKRAADQAQSSASFLRSPKGLNRGHHPSPWMKLLRSPLCRNEAAGSVRLCSGCRVTDGEQGGPRGPCGYPGRAPHLGCQDQAGERSSGEAYPTCPGTGRRGTAHPTSAPWGGQAPGDREPFWSAPRPASSAGSFWGRKMEREEARPVPGLLGAASGRRVPLKFTSCICTPSGRTRAAQATVASPIATTGSQVSLPLFWCCLREEKVPRPQEPTTVESSASASEQLLSYGSRSQSFHDRGSRQDSASPRSSKCSEAGRCQMTR